MTEHRQRKKIRLRHFDYSQNGSYFVTICTQERAMLFGNVTNGTMTYNDYGQIAVEEIHNTNKLRKNAGISISKYIVMPNHVHFILEIVGARRVVPIAPQYENFSKPTEQSVPTIVRAYKAAVTKRIRRLDGHDTSCPYDIWQRSFYEHIIRNEQDYITIAEYINNNPLKWEEDRFYTKNHNEKG